MERIKKWFSTKKALKITVLIVLILAIILGIVFSAAGNASQKVKTAKVRRAKVKQYYDTTGIISSGNSDKYYLYEGVVAEKVNVKPGDSVKKGDILATFNTASMNSVISEKRSALANAEKEYNSVVENKNNAEQRKAEIDSERADLEAKKDAMSAGKDAALPGNEIKIQTLNSQIAMLNSEKNMIDAGQYDSVIAARRKAVEAARNDYNTALSEKKHLDAGFVANGDGKVGNVYIKEGEAYTYDEDAAENSQSMLSMLLGSSGMPQDESGELLSGIVSSSTNGLRRGVGMVVDYYDGYKIAFDLGKYDVQKIKVGMPVIISYTDYKYDGVVSYKSPYADNGSSPVSDMMGNSNVKNKSSLSAEVSIDKPDDNLIVGFDAKLSILMAEHDNALVVPVESLVIEKGKKYVYIYDEETGTAVRREVKVGISSESMYEILGGLKEGETVIVDSSSVTDGAKVRAKGDVR